MIATFLYLHEFFNSLGLQIVFLIHLPYSVTYMRQWIVPAFVEIMVVACMARSHYLNQSWIIINWTIGNTLQWNSNQNTKFFIQENASENIACHYNDIIMTTMASQITSLMNIYLIVYSDADQRKHQSSASQAFVRGNHRLPVNSPHKWPVTRKMFPFDDVIMEMASILSRVRWVNSLRLNDAYIRKWTNQHWLRSWLLTWTAPSHYLKQCWNIVN